MSKIDNLQAIEYSVDVTKSYSKDMVALFNEDNISEKEVREFVESGLVICESHPKIVTMTREQYQNLMS